jgi:hypothetical protein
MSSKYLLIEKKNKKKLKKGLGHKNKIKKQKIKKNKKTKKFFSLMCVC